MAQAIAAKEKPSLSASSSAGLKASLITLFFLALWIFLGLSTLSPPGAVSSNAPLTDFASGRAKKHLEAIAQRPHPPGTPEHSVVQNYIVKELAANGINAEVQKATVVNGWPNGQAIAASVENIIGRLAGTGRGQPVMFVAHYDSVPIGPGASDDGVAVAALLEVLRALRAGPSLRNDVIFLFTDAEEAGLLGAEAYMDEHPGAKNTGVVFNFDARGVSGPSIMFETSDANGKLIWEFAKAVPNPVANSLSFEIYKRLPNATDMTVFKEGGLTGLNFAYIRGLNFYHTQSDNIERADERSLQHDGSYGLALARHFGNLDLSNMREPNAIYFNIPGAVLVRYSEIVGKLITAAVAGLFILVVGIGLKRNRLSVLGILAGFGGFFAAVLISTLALSVSWSLINRLHPEIVAFPAGEPYDSSWCLLGFAALTLAILSCLYLVFDKRLTIENSTVGALLWWFLLMVFTAVVVPSGSFLFTWPLLFCLIPPGFSFLATGRDMSLTKKALILSACAAPGIVLLAPMIYMTVLAMTLKVTTVLAILLMLFFGMLIPHLKMVSAPKPWALPVISAVVALILFVSAGVMSGTDKNHPQVDNIFYAMNADSGRAVWASSDQKPDAWTSQFFGNEYKRGSLAEYLTSNPNNFLKTEAPAATLAPPLVNIENDSARNGVRFVRLQVISVRNAPEMFFEIEPGAKISSISVNGKQLRKSPENGWIIRYIGLPKDGFNIALTLSTDGALKIKATDLSYGVPDLPDKSYRPRLDYFVPSQATFSDSTVVTKSFTF